jgi:cytochrome P450
MQAQIILATLLARFHFAPVGQAPRPVMHMTIRPEPGVQLVATPTAERATGHRSGESMSIQA